MVKVGKSIKAHLRFQIDKLKPMLLYIMDLDIYTEVGNYINTMKTIFFIILVLIVNKLLTKYKFTSNQREDF